MAKRKEFFDSYRGLGACVICLYHYLNTFGLEGCAGSRVYDLLFDIKNIGYVMVEFFYYEKENIKDLSDVFLDYNDSNYFRDDIKEASYTF